MSAPHRARSTAASSARSADLRRLLAATDAAVTFYRSQLARHDGPRRYLDSRGLGVLVEREWPWRVGYAPPGWTTLTQHLRTAGFTDTELVAAGLSTPTRSDATRLIDVFRDRVVFPIRDPAGHAVAFIGRAGPNAGDEVPKYLNTAETPLYDKGRMLFGVAEQQDRLAAGWTPVLVEGPADALAVWLSYSRSGSTGAVALAPCGTAFTETQAAIVGQLPGAADAITVAFDGDAAGRSAADAAFDLLRDSATPRRLLAAEFPSGADPADLLRRPNGRAQLRAALQRQVRPLAVAVIDHQLDRMVGRHPRLLEDIGGRHTAAKAVIPLVFAATDQAEAARLLQHVVTRTGVGLDTAASLAADHVGDLVNDVTTEIDKRLALPSTSRPPPSAAAFPRLQTAGVGASTTAPSTAPVPPAAARASRSR